MTRTEYEAKRKTLINEAETLINEGKVDDANEKMNNNRFVGVLHTIPVLFWLAYFLLVFE